MLCLCYVIKPELPLSLVSVRRKCSLNQTRVSSSDDMFFLFMHLPQTQK